MSNSNTAKFFGMLANQEEIDTMVFALNQVVPKLKRLKDGDGFYFTDKHTDALTKLVDALGRAN